MKALKINGDLIDFCDYTDAEIDDEISVAEALIERITGDIFYNKAATLSFDGNGLTRLFFLPEHPYKLLTIVSVKDFDVDGTTLLDTYVEGTDFVVYDYYLETALSFSGESPRRRFGTGGVWPKGQKNIAIEGTWGVTSVPAAIKKVAKLLTAESLIKGITSLQAGDAQEIEWEDFTVKFKGGTGSDDHGRATGFYELDRILVNYINYAPMFLAIPDNRESYDRSGR